MNEGCVISKLAAGDDEDRVKKQMHLWLCKVFRVCPYSLSMDTMAYQGPNPRSPWLRLLIN